MRPVHYTAAALVFLLGLTYCWIQTAISLRHGPCDCVTVLQVLSSTVLTTCLVTCILAWYHLLVFYTGIMDYGLL